MLVNTQPKKHYNLKNKLVRSWSFWGTIITSLALGLTIWIYLIQKENLDVKLYLLTKTDLIEESGNLGKVKILYDSTDISELNQNIQLLTVKIVNEGNVDVLKGMFDEDFPLGFDFENITFLDNPDLTDHSSDYLKNSVSVTIDNQDHRLILSDFILEQGEYFTVKVLVIHPEGKRPNVNPIGKIAGIKALSIEDLSKQTSDNPLQTFLWFSTTVGVFFVFFFLYHMMNGSSEKRAIFFLSYTSNFSEQEYVRNVIGKIYIDEGYEKLKRLFEYSEAIAEDYRLYQKIKESNPRNHFEKSKNKGPDYYPIREMLEKLEFYSILESKPNKVIFLESYFEQFQNFINVLKDANKH